MSYRHTQSRVSRDSRFCPVEGEEKPYRSLQTLSAYTWILMVARLPDRPLLMLTGKGRSARDHHVAHSFGGWLKKPELFKMSTQEIQQS